jgi:hypothetical protein
VSDLRIPNFRFVESSLIGRSILLDGKFLMRICAIPSLGSRCELVSGQVFRLFASAAQQ